MHLDVAGVVRGLQLPLQKRNKSVGLRGTVTRRTACSEAALACAIVDLPASNCCSAAACSCAAAAAAARASAVLALCSASSLALQ